jgi:hypothetical protein
MTANSPHTRCKVGLVVGVDYLSMHYIYFVHNWLHCCNVACSGLKPCDPSFNRAIIEQSQVAQSIIKVVVVLLILNSHLHLHFSYLSALEIYIQAELTQVNI